MRTQEAQMREAFKKRAKEILNSEDRFIKIDNQTKIGLESEVALIDCGNKKKLTQIRDKIVSAHPDFLDVELGATQIELRTPPLEIAETISEYRRLNLILLEEAYKHGVSILRLGSNPFVPTDKIQRTDEKKYRLVPDYHDTNRTDFSGTIGRIPAKSLGADIVSLFQSFQINLEASSFEDAIEKLNYSLMIGPWLLSVATNSRFLNLRNVGIADIRMPAWEATHNSAYKKVRVGLPEEYFRDMQHYLDRILEFPFILFDPKRALEIGIGLNWSDTRIKFIENSLVVEFRLLPTQVSIEKELWLMLLWINTLSYLQANKVPLVPIEIVRQARELVMS